jgi:hypothetical protein
MHEVSLCHNVEMIDRVNGIMKEDIMATRERNVDVSTRKRPKNSKQDKSKKLRKLRKEGKNKKKGEME